VGFEGSWPQPIPDLLDSSSTAINHNETGLYPAVPHPWVNALDEDNPICGSRCVSQPLGRLAGWFESGVLMT
jgi:hypothetical protein